MWYLWGQSWECAGFHSKHYSSCLRWLVPLWLKVLISEIIQGHVGWNKNKHAQLKRETPHRNTHAQKLHILGMRTGVPMCLTCRSCIWCWSPAGTSPQPPWTPGIDGRVLYPIAASPECRGRRRLVRRRLMLHRGRRRPWRSSSSRARSWEPPPPIAETAAYDWSSDGSSFTHRHLILSGLREGQTMIII